LFEINPFVYVCLLERSLNFVLIQRYNS